MTDSDKNLILEQANLYLAGNSFREIASKYGVSQVTVKNNLTKRLKAIDEELYNKVIKRVDEQTPKVDNERILTAYHLLVDEDKTVLEIVDEMNKSRSVDNLVTEFMIYRDLTVRLLKLHKNLPDLVNLDMIEKVKNTLERHRLGNLNINLQENESIKTGIVFDGSNVYPCILMMYPKKESRTLFLQQVALSFGLRLEALSELTGFNKDTLMTYLTENSGALKHSLDFLFEHGFVNQDKAKQDFLIYFNSLINACNRKDKEQIRSLLEVLSDKKAVDIQKRDKNYGSLSDDDIAIILNYQLKYGLTDTQISSIFDINRRYYGKLVTDYIEDKPRLRSDYEYISDYYINSWLRR